MIEAMSVARCCGGNISKMVENLKTFFNRILSRVDGLHAIIMTDRDGVPVFRASDEHVPDSALKPRFLATFGVATEQASKLGLSNNRNLITYFGAYQVVCVNKLPLIVTLIASSEANTGMILGLVPEMEDVLQDLRNLVIASSQQRS